eukprot:362536-Chlamydomonas_euryale.AAC.11
MRNGAYTICIAACPFRASVSAHQGAPQMPILRTSGRLHLPCQQHIVPGVCHTFRWPIDCPPAEHPSKGEGLAGRLLREGGLAGRPLPGVRLADRAHLWRPIHLVLQVSPLLLCHRELGLEEAKLLKGEAWHRGGRARRQATGTDVKNATRLNRPVQACKCPHQWWP